MKSLVSGTKVSFRTFPNPIVNLDFHMKTDPGLSWVSNDRQNSLELPTICKICNHAPISSKWPHSSITTFLEPKNTNFDMCINYFSYSKMAISKCKNGHFEEIGALLQILQIMGNSTLFYLCIIWLPCQPWSHPHMEMGIFLSSSPCLQRRFLRKTVWKLVIWNW